MCGDGKMAGKEQCDGNDLGGATCTSVVGEPAKGNLSCSADCKLDSSACLYCGDGKKSSGEQCDGKDFGGDTCASVYGVGSVGQLFCFNDCQSVEITDCSKPVCGDGVKNGLEQCDGSPGSATCAEKIGGISSGSVVCSPACKLDLSGCSAMCNPVTLDGCYSEEYLCDFFGDIGLACYATPGGVERCGKCSLDFCKPGLHCLNEVCAKFCASDSDCAGSGVCDLEQGAQGFGLCVVAKGTAEASCN